MRGTNELPFRWGGGQIHEHFNEKAGVDQLIQDICERQIYCCSFPVYLNWKGIVIGGQPDRIVFLNSKPRYLIEYKTTSRLIDRIWDSEIVQAELYGLGLESMGFDCSQLDCVIVKLNRKEFSEEEEFSKLIELSRWVILEETREPKGVIFKDFTFKYSYSREDLKEALGYWRRFEYSREAAIKDLERALPYWIMERDPILGGLKRHDSKPVNNANKCKKCEYYKSGDCQGFIL